MTNLRQQLGCSLVLFCALLISSCATDRNEQSSIEPDSSGSSTQKSLREPVPTAAPMAPNGPLNAPNIPDAVVTAPPAEAIEAPIVEAESEQLAIGNILFNTPKTMTLGVTETIEVRLSKSEISELNLIGSGELQTEHLLVSERMSVKLCCGDASKGDPFDIQSPSSEVQSVDGLNDPEGYTEWLFRVTPRSEGKHYLQLFVSVHQVTQSGRDVKRDRVLKRLIQVDVNRSDQISQWLKSQWHWLGLLLVIPLAAYMISRRLKTHKQRTHRSGNESVFISYRRDDSSGYTLAIYEKLKQALGDEHVFMDIDDIPHGEDFAKHIQKVLSKADSVLVMIGQDWLNAHNEQGRRLDQDDDFVRMEIATALNNQLRVIPVLLKGADMPGHDDLPDVLKGLAMRNGIRIHDDQFDASINRLINSISQ